MKLSKKQRHLVAAIVGFQKAGVKSVTLVHLADAIYEGIGVDRPKNWRQAMSMTVRTLAPKIEKQGCILEKTTGIGRGVTATYRFSGPFKWLLN